MDYRVILSRPALRDLGEIARYIAQDNPTAAERVGLELVQLAESLAVMPRRGGQLRARPGVRRLVREPYFVTYRIDETQRVVYVQRFWHAKRDPQSFTAS
ncbi:MAG: type II toxin-antitoxin system RelE/ParE family toxin [Opitutaceae bacterium]